MGPSQICGCPFREPRVFEIAHIYIYIYEPGPRTPTPPPSPPMVSPPTPNPPHPPTPPKPSICMLFAHIHTHIHIYIYFPFHPSNLASLRYLQHLRATTSSTDLVYLYISIITFFRTAYSVPRTWFTTYLLPMDYAKLTYANLDICTVEKHIYIYAHSRYYILVS